MKTTRYFLFSVLALLTCSISSVAFAIEDSVQLTAGAVAGVKLESGIKVYRGMPFAAPPVGDLRWRQPQEVTPWQGVRQASQFAPVCMQGSRGDTLMSEHCLYFECMDARRFRSV